MTFNEIKNIFIKLKIPEWKVTGQIGRESGQAIVLEVTRERDNKKGVFRYLKRKEEVDIKRFKREIEILTSEKYRHPNIINILAYSINEFWYISEMGMPFKKHWTEIKQKYSENSEQILKIAISYLREIISGLSILHNEKVVHRDIKPDNIIIVNNKPVLIDFGLIFHPEEDRITPIDSAVGNARYSPDQMMNRLKEAPPWLDVFQLSQLLIWMISDRPTKNWSRPLDWRWVIYPANMSDLNVLSIKAITAICSDPYASPSNAKELDKLISNLMDFEFSKNHPDKNVNDIIESIKNGKAKSVISGSNDLISFNTSLPIFEKFYFQIESHIKELANIGEGALPIKFVAKDNLVNWAENIQKTTKFNSHQTNYPYDLQCGELNQGYFRLTTVNIFWVPSQIIEKASADYLPNNFLPITMEFAIGSNKDNLQHAKPRHLFIAIDNTGQLWKSQYANDFKSTRKQIDISELLNIFTSWIKDKESWEIINT